MKPIFRLSLPLALLAATACTTSDNDPLAVAPLAPVTAGSSRTLVYDEQLFPKPDKSVDLNYSNTIFNFNRLVRAIAPEQALNRDALHLTNEQYAAIAAFTADLVKQHSTTRAKVQAINTWLYRNISHTLADNEAWTVFNTRKGVCQGFANLYKAMLHTLGVPVILVNGQLVGIGGHAWNYVHADGKWYVADPTNNGFWSIDQYELYDSLRPEMADIVIFEDDNFVYNFYEGRLNLWEVKKGESRLVVPFSIRNFRVGTFNPHRPLPDNVKHIYLGSNIRSIGSSIVGLQVHPAQDEAVFVAPGNPSLGSVNGVLYRRERQRLTDLLYIPSRKTSVTLLPIPTVGKNTIYNLPHLEELVFPPGTKRLEAYAIENCPRLQRLYLPADCEMDENAVYRCSPDLDIQRGDFTSIRRVWQ